MRRCENGRLFSATRRKPMTTMAKFLAVVSFSGVFGYLLLSAANPEMSQHMRDGWRRIVDPPLVTATPTLVPTLPPEPPGLTDEELVFFQQRMLVLVNEARSEFGLRPLALDRNSAAQEHAEDLMRHCRISHEGSDGSSVATRYVRNGGRWRRIAENIHLEGFCPIRRYGYVDLTFDDLIERAHDGLMGSPGHSGNILNLWHESVSFGFAYNDPNFWVVQVFVRSRP